MMQFFENHTGRQQPNDVSGAPIALDDQEAMKVDQDLEGVCRICLGEDDEGISNPLFSPCKCAGSMGLIHLDCLK